MLGFLSENRVPVLAVVLLFSFLLLVSAQVRLPDSAARLQGGAAAVVSPVVRLAASTAGAVRGVWTGYVDLRETGEENRRLRRQVMALQLETARLAELGRENSRLTGLLDLQEALTIPNVAARVLTLRLSGPFRTAMVDRGWRHGLSRDNPVITPDGVVGRVTTVTSTLAQVQLIVDPTSGAAAVIQGSRVQGMVVGRAVNELEMRFVSTLADLGPGDWVDTSGLEGIYPGGLRLGRVREVLHGGGLEQRVVLDTSVDFRALEEVLILTDGTGHPVLPGTGEGDGAGSETRPAGGAGR